MSKLDDIELADFLDYEGIEYKETSGSSGEQFNLRECPSCGNANFKVYLNSESGFGNCFVCGTTFNRWTFLVDYLGTKDRSQIRKFISKLARDLGYRPKKKMKVLAETDDIQAKLPQSIPLPDRKGRNSPYLEERGITAEYSKRFNLRLCQFGSHVYERDGEEIHQRFDDRIIIPVFDLNGDLVTFQGRDLTGHSDRKYLFPARLPATARYLYNGHEALALRAKEVIMCEGAFDVIPVAVACDQFPEMHRVVPIGSFGKDLTDTRNGPGQVDALRTLKQKGYLETVTVMWDGEESALISALDAADKIQSIGLEARIALLPAGCDPNEVQMSQIRDSYLKATKYTRLLSVRWRTQNPYKT
ncbi:MAG: hypothetical protein NXH70_02495 [Hyphomonas sp.]|nr:hypothetical protein [Hyphomonas sp.]